MKRTISLIVIISMVMAATINPVFATPTIDLNKMRSSLETILMNRAEDAKAMLTIASELVKYAAAKFKDVKDSDWFAEAVGKMNILKIIDGLPDGSFNPQGQVTRAQFVKMLVQAMEYKKVDSVSFDDLRPFPTSKPHWASVYIETALRNGVIVKEEIGNNFFPDVPLTRRDMGIMMFRALKLSPSTGENPFADLTEANGSLTKLYEEYLVRGNIEGGKRLYKPEGLTTRAEAAVIIARMVEYKENPQAYKESMKKQDQIGMPLDIYNKLMADKKNLDGKTMEQANKELYDYVQKSVYLKQYNYAPEQLVDRFVKLAYSYVMADWNIDYRTVENTYAEKVKEIIPYDHYTQDLPITIKYYKDNKLVQEAVFYTNRDLVYKRGVSYYVRGTVIFRLLEPTSNNFIKRMQERDNGKLLSLNQWYSEDIEVDIAGAATPGNPIIDLRVFGVKILNQPKSIER